MFLVIALVTFSLWIVMALSTAILDEREQVASQHAVASEIVAGEGEERVLTRISAHPVPVAPGQELALRVLVANQTTVPLEEVRIDRFAVPGFGFGQGFAGGGLMWPCAGEQVGRCAGSARSSTCFRLEPGDTLALCADLLAGEAEGSHLLQGVAEWKTSLGDQTEVRRSSILAVDGLEVRSAGATFWKSFGSALISLFRDFALPIVLAVLAVAFDRFQRQRDQRTKQEEEDRAREQETWSLMLPKMQRGTERFYLALTMHAISAAHHLAQVSSRLRDPKPTQADDDFRRGVYYFLSFAHCARRLFYEQGGYSLKDRAGERLIAACWNCLFEGATSAIDYLDWARALDALRPNESYARFRDRLESARDVAKGQEQAALKRVESALVGWVRSPDLRLDIAVLRLYHHALHYEMNRIYERWYPEPEPFPVSDLEALRAELGHHGQGAERFETVRDRLRAYLESERAKRTGPTRAGV